MYKSLQIGYLTMIILYNAPIFGMTTMMSCAAKEAVLPLGLMNPLPRFSLPP